MGKFIFNDLISAKGELDKIVESSKKEKLPANLAFKIAVLLKELTIYFIEFEKFQIELAQKYGKPDSIDPEKIVIQKEDVPKVNDELNQFLIKEVEFVSSVNFKIADFENTKLDILEASALLSFIKPE